MSSASSKKKNPKQVSSRQQQSKRRGKNATCRLSRQTEIKKEKNPQGEGWGGRLMSSFAVSGETVRYQSTKTIKEEKRKKRRKSSREQGEEGMMKHKWGASR